jgi:hypothetical protein
MSNHAEDESIAATLALARAAGLQRFSSATEGSDEPSEASEPGGGVGEEDASVAAIAALARAAGIKRFGS